jgi:class 3 adenylate cyclase/predicted negative regulator of RcsB-dependent stress response
MKDAKAMHKTMKEFMENPAYSEGFALFRHGKWQSARAFFEKILENYEPAGDIAWLYFICGTIGGFQGKTKEAEKSFLQVLEIEDGHHSSASLAAFCEMILINVKRGEMEKAGAAFEGLPSYLKAILDDGPDEGGRAQFHHYRGICRYRLRRTQEGFDDLGKALKHAEMAASPLQSARIHDTLGQFSFEKGNIDDAIYHFKESLSLKEKSDDLFGMALTWGNLGRAYLLMGNHQEALDYLRRDLEFCQSSEDLFGQMIMTNNMGRALVHAGQLQQAMAHFEKSYELALTFDNRLWITMNLKDMAEAHVEAGRLKEAEELLDEAMTRVESFGDDRLRAEILSIAGLHCRKTGAFEAAERSYKEALALLGRQDVPYHLVIVTMQIGMLKFEKGEKKEAYLLFDECLEKAEALRAPWLIEKIEQLIRRVGELEWIRVRLRRYVGREVFDEILTGTERSALGGRRQKVTVLVSDIRGYTEFSENRSPEDIVAMLNDYFSLMVEAITGKKGTIDKFIGDAIMAYFGAPVTYGDDSFRALQAARAMMEALEKFNKMRAQSGEEPIRMGIGIDTGVVVVGNIGSYGRKDYTVVGKAVTGAFTLCGRAKAGQVLISESTWQENESQLVGGKAISSQTGEENFHDFAWRC